MSPPLSLACFSSLPPELLVMIFQSACDDDGTTARSLALVSRIFCIWALPFTYHALTIHDASRVGILIKRLQRHPEHTSLVRHMLIADQTATLDCLALERSLKTLWRLISSKLQSLTLMVNSRCNTVGGVFQTVFDAPFPHLTALTLCGEHPIPSPFIKMPALRYFHTAGLVKRNAASCFTPLTHSCPELSHIRISMTAEQNLTFAISAAFDLPGAPTNIERMCLDPMPVPEIDSTPGTFIPFPSLPNNLISLTVKPSAPPVMHFPGASTMFYCQYIKQLDDLALECHPGKFQLLPPFKREMWNVESYTIAEAKKDWADTMRGGMGAWGMHTKC